MVTQNKDYGNVNPPNGQATNQPTCLEPPSSDPIPPSIPMDFTIKHLNGFIHKFSFKPHSRAAQITM